MIEVQRGCELRWRVLFSVGGAGRGLLKIVLVNLDLCWMLGAQVYRVVVRLVGRVRRHAMERLGLHLVFQQCRSVRKVLGLVVAAAGIGLMPPPMVNGWVELESTEE